jgi:hypothetical protein
MFLEIVTTQNRFVYNEKALTGLLRKIESTIKDNRSVCGGILELANFRMSDTAKRRYPKEVTTRDMVLEALKPDNAPAVTPMHQMYLAQGVDPDWVMVLSGEKPPRIQVLAELIRLWEKNQTDVFLTRQLTSIITMGLANYFLDLKDKLPDASRDVMLTGRLGIPSHLKEFATKAFGALGWPAEHYLPTRANFDTAGHKIPVPNPAATHP